MKIVRPYKDINIRSLVMQVHSKRKSVSSLEGLTGNHGEFFVIGKDDVGHNVIDTGKTFRNDRDIATEIDNGYRLFIPFAGPIVPGEPLAAVNGRMYRFVFGDERIPDPDSCKNVIVGYLVERNNGSLKIVSAESAIPSSCPSKIHHVKEKVMRVLDGDMCRFVEQFAKPTVSSCRK